MNLALERLRERKKNPPVTPPIVEESVPGFINTFFADPLPQMQDNTPTPGLYELDGTPYTLKWQAQATAKPALPDELSAFSYLYRMAYSNTLPPDKAEEIIEAIHSVADMLPNRARRRLMIEARVEELQELSDWLLLWTPPQFEVGEDPFAEPVL